MTMPDRETLLTEIEERVDAFLALDRRYLFDREAPRIRLHEPTFGAPEIMAALEPLLTTMVTMGPKVAGFEDAFCRTIGYGHGVSCNSGSSANLLAVAALTNPACEDHLRPGDEVVVSALSWSTTVWPLIQCGLTPVIVDIDPATLNIDPEQVERAIGPKTRAIMPVHVYGNPCDMDALMDIRARHNLIMIEDGCESMGAAYDGKPVGGIGRVGTFSFYFSHHITTLEGGICVTEDAGLAELMRILRAHGWVRHVNDPQPYYDTRPEIDPKFLFVNLGFNLRLTEPQGAMGAVQTPKLRGIVQKRKQAAERWRRIFSAQGELVTLQSTTPKGDHSWFGFPLTLADAVDVAGFRAGLTEAGIENRPIICGNIARQPAIEMFEHRTVGDLVHASRVMTHGVSVGCHQGVGREALDYAADVIPRIFRSALT